jgi:hypothetical protein
MAELIMVLFYVYLGIYALSCSIDIGIIYLVINNYLPNYGGYYYFLYVPTILVVNYFLMLLLSRGNKQISKTFNKEGV